MAFCEACGSQLSDGGNFCGSCGTSTTANAGISIGSGYSPSYTAPVYLAPDKKSMNMNQKYLIASCLFLFAAITAFLSFQSSWYSVTFQITEIDGEDADVRYSFDEYLEKRIEKDSYDYMGETDSSTTELDNDELKLEYQETAKMKTIMVYLLYIELGAIAILMLLSFVETFSNSGEGGGALSVFGIFVFAIIVANVIFFTLLYNPADDGFSSGDEDIDLTITEETSSGTFWSLEATIEGELEGSTFKARTFGGVGNGYFFNVVTGLLLFIGTFFVAYEASENY
jgi:hypothetical protein